MSNETRNERLAGIVEKLDHDYNCGCFEPAETEGCVCWKSKLRAALAEPVAQPQGVGEHEFGLRCSAHARELGYDVGDGDWQDVSEVVVALIRAGHRNASQAAIHAAQLLAYTAELPADIKAAEAVIRKVSEP